MTQQAGAGQRLVGTPPARRGPAGTAQRAVACASLAAVAGYAVSTVPGVRDGEAWDPLLDGWLQGAGYVLLAVWAALRPVLDPDRRTGWTLVAVAVGLRCLGFVLFHRPHEVRRRLGSLRLGSSGVLVDDRSS